ncbi:MAG TPA: DUF308 domain-containing protein [Microlunatus sp.]|jgi:uncharacterized membrane protein HdeD (DUF308 family)
MAVIQPSHEYGSIAHKVWPWSMTRGGLAVLFGILGFALLLPMGTMRTFAMVIGIFAILDGVANGVEAVRWRGGTMILRGIAGLVGVAFGVTALLMTSMTMNQLIWMTAIWAFVIGGLEVVTNIIERSSEHRDWMFGMIMGGFGVALGVVVVIMMPLLTMLIWFASVATILWGIAGLIMGASERRLSRTD